MRHDTKAAAVGRWPAILKALGMPAATVSGKHCACPICDAGKDRFRFDDRGGAGTWLCNKCGFGTGIDLVMKWKQVAFTEACRLVDSVIPGAAAAPSAAKRADDGALAEIGMRLWREARALDGTDLASRYLKRRGIVQPFPSMLRFHPKMRYTHADNSKTIHPAMIARYVSPDAAVSSFHLTFLDGTGNKARFADDADNVRKFFPGRIPDGGAVRLCPSADTLGIAEGIETAMSAMQRFDVPVWAALNAVLLMKWQPPQTSRNIIVFGDADEGFDGQMKAYALAHRLKLTGFNVEVRIPDLLGTDWNDFLEQEVA